MNKRKCRRGFAFWIFLPVLLFALLGGWVSNVYGGNPEEDKQNLIQEDMMKEYDFREVDRMLDAILPGERITFEDVIAALLNQDLKQVVSYMGKLLMQNFGNDFASAKMAMIQMLMLGIMAAFFSNFSDAFQNSQLSDTAIYVVFLVLMTLLISSFQEILQSVEESVQCLTGFMAVLSPVYFFSVAIATGGSTAVVFYELLLLFIYVVEVLILRFLLPFVQMDMMIHLLNHLSLEERLSHLAELMDTVVRWSLRTALAFVVGLNVVQGLLTPAIDTVKRSALTKGVEAIPGVGDAASGVTEIVLSTAVLIKNGIGTAGMLITLVICMVPLCKVAVLALLYKLTAALLEPISDKRITGAIGSFSVGYTLLVQVVFTVGMLFLLTIAVVTATASR